MGSSSSKEGQEGQLLKIGEAYTWKLQGYTRLACNTWIRSPTFEVAEKPFFLELYKDKRIEIRLRQEKPGVDHSFSCFICLLDWKGVELFKRVKTVVLKRDEESKETDAVIQQVNLLKLRIEDMKQLERTLLLNDALTVSFRGTLMDADGKADVLREGNTFLETLSSDFGELYSNKSNLADVVLKAGDRKFPVHRVILSARSKVFAAMFQHDMLEKKTGTVHISDVEPDILDDVLFYIYTGKLRKQNAATAHLMFAAADKYAMDVLKNKCRNVIIATLTTENISHAATLADTYQDEILMKEVIKFFGEEQEKILRSEPWNNFMAEKPRLANGILVSALKAGRRVSES